MCETTIDSLVFGSSKLLGCWSIAADTMFDQPRPTEQHD